MTKGYIIFVLSFVIAQRALAQPSRTSAVQPLLKQLAVSRPDSNRVDCLLKLAACYQLRPGEYKSDIDSAFLLTAGADTLARSIGYKPGIDRAALRVCQIQVEINDTLGLERRYPTLSDSNKVKLLLEWSAHYIFVASVTHRNDIDRFSRQSQKLSAAIGTARIKCLNDELLAISGIALGNFDKGQKYARQCLAFFDSTRDYRSLDELCYRLRVLASKPHGHNDSLMEFCNRYDLRKDLHDSDYQKLEVIYGQLRTFADAHRDYAGAIRWDLETLRMGGLIHDTLALPVYTNLIQDYSHNGDMYHALFYCHAALPLLVPGRSPDEAYYYIYYEFGQIYWQMSRLDLCIQYCKKGLEDIRRSKLLPGRSHDMLLNACSFEVAIARNEALALCKQGRATEGLRLMEDLEKPTPYPRINIPMLLLTKAECYAALKDDDKAAACFGASLDKTSNPSKSDSLRAALPLARFYMDKGKPQKARAQVQKLLHSKDALVSPYRLRDAYYLLYEADSAEGNYRSALKNLKDYKDLNDSLFSADKNSQLETQQLQFATEEKDRDMRTQTQHIQLLQKEQELRTTQIRTDRLVRNMLLAGVLLFLLLLIVLYNRYRLKNRSARLLEVEQRTVEEKNHLLQQVVEEKEDLLVEKDDLLVEKEWLLKEVHHRVKNNLQIVVSLLSMASGSIDNEVAERYIGESRNRIYAMSLIHQKLYKTGGMVSIELDDYIRDLLAYLDTNYNTGKRVHFRADTEKLTVDASIAVPIGLILNEAVTNAIKHAFPNGRRGTIRVVLQQTRTPNIRLVISDDGIGLSSAAADNKKWSIGMNLMKALAGQVHGTFGLTERAGVAIEIEFPLDQYIKSPLLS